MATCILCIVTVRCYLLNYFHTCISPISWQIYFVANYHFSTGFSCGFYVLQWVPPQITLVVAYRRHTFFFLQEKNFAIFVIESPTTKFNQEYLITSRNERDIRNMKGCSGIHVYDKDRSLLLQV